MKGYPLHSLQSNSHTKVTYEVVLPGLKDQIVANDKDTARLLKACK